MANQRRSRAKPVAETLRDTVFQIASEMEEPLRHALQMVRLVSLVDPQDDEDKEAIGFVAHEACARLKTVSERLRELFAACAGP